jgi:hypothetical protein
LPRKVSGVRRRICPEPHPPLVTAT